MASEAKNKTKNKVSCNELKILTPKQLFQILLIALAQITLCEKCPNTKLFLVRIFLFSD